MGTFERENFREFQGFAAICERKSYFLPTHKSSLLYNYIPDNLSYRTALNSWAFHTHLNIQPTKLQFTWGAPFDIIAIVWMLIVNVEACKEPSYVYI